MNWKKVVLLVTASLTLLAAIPAYGRLAATAAARELQADAEWRAAASNVRVGDTITLALEGIRLSNLVAFEAFVEIEPDKLALVEAKAGWNGFDVSPSMKGSTVLHFASTRLGKQAEVSGNRTLSKFKFKILQAGDIKLKLKKIVFVDSSLQSRTLEKDIELNLSAVNGPPTNPPNGPPTNPPVEQTPQPAFVPNAQVVRRAAVAPAKADEYFQITASQSGLPGTLRPAGELFDLQFTASEPKVALPVKDVDNRSLHKLGVYRLDTDSLKWVYAGGKLDKTNMELEFVAEQLGMYAVMEYERSFQDLSGHWARTIIEQMAAQHIAQGTGTDTFEPEVAVTRAEFAAFLVRSLGMSSSDPSSQFLDVEEEAWFYPVIASAVNNGIIDADSGTARPNDHVTREEMIVMLMRAYMKVQGKDQILPSASVDLQAGVLAEGQSAFEDAGDIAAWSLEAVQLSKALGIIEGAESNRFFPKEQATRAESMAVLLRLLEQL